MSVLVLVLVLVMPPSRLRTCPEGAKPLLHKRMNRRLINRRRDHHQPIYLAV